MEELKTLIFNGTPRKNGDTDFMIKAFSKELGGEIMTVSSHFDNISPCVDCRYCWDNAGCALQDDMQKVYPFLESCDVFVMASPIWFSEISGPLLNLASRLQTYFAASYFRHEESRAKAKRKTGVLLLAGAQEGTEKKAVSTANTIFKLANAYPPVHIFSLKTDKIIPSDDPELAFKIEKAVKEIKFAAIN